MKKLLSLMAVLTVVSAASTLAVSCSSTSTEQYKKFESYVNESKNSTVVVYIGADDNNSSISFQKGLEEVTGTSS